MNVFENDGSYPGDPCASTSHSGHKGYLDSPVETVEENQPILSLVSGKRCLPERPRLVFPERLQ